MMGKYDMYAPLTVSQEKIYQECANTEFQKGESYLLTPLERHLKQIN